MSPIKRRRRPMLISTKLLREIARLERKLKRATDTESQVRIIEEIEDARTELRQYEAWRAEGAERGWLGGGG